MPPTKRKMGGIPSPNDFILENYSIYILSPGTLLTESRYETEISVTP